MLKLLWENLFLGGEKKSIFTKDFVIHEILIFYMNNFLKYLIFKIFSYENGF